MLQVMKRLLAMVTLLSCAPNTVLEARNFERECTTAGQCRPVLFGDLCGACSCLNGAVNEQGFGKYDYERSKITCAASNQGCQAQCPQPVVACEDGGCVLIQ